MLLKAIIINTDEKPPTIIPVMFNPPQLDIRKASNYSRTKNPKQDESENIFLQGDNEELSMELFFDTTDLGVDVRVITDKIVELVKVKKGGEEPPHLMFVWGPMCFDCMMTNVQQKYEHFNSLGLALRAVLNVTFVGYDMRKKLLQHLPLGQMATLTTYMVREGDTIGTIAAKKKGNPKEWRSIASENNIRNPLTIPSGTNLKISEQDK